MDEIEVLVCDDSALMRNLISRIIDGTEGMKVCGTAMNGKFALQKLDTLKPDMILLDIEMPLLNGFNTLSSIRQSERLKEIPVMFLTASATPDTVREAIRLGVTSYLRKPFLPNELTDKVSALLGSQK